MVIYRGSAADIPDLKLLLCTYYLQKNDTQKIPELVCLKGVLKKIISDVYGCNYEGVKKLRLVD